MRTNMHTNMRARTCAGWGNGTQDRQNGVPRLEMRLRRARAYHRHAEGRRCARERAILASERNVPALPTLGQAQIASESAAIWEEVPRLRLNRHPHATENGNVWY